MTAPGALRIAVWHNLLGGGGKRALYLAVRWLASRGHHIETWCPDSADLENWPLDEFGPQHVLPLAPRPRKSPFRRFWPAYYRVLDQLDTMERHAFEVGRAIEQDGFDVVFANPCQFLAAPILADFIDCPTVLWLNEPRRALYECGPAWPWHAPYFVGTGLWSPRYLKRGIENLMNAQGARVQAREEARNARLCARLLTNSRYSRESLLRAYSLDSHICYPAVDADTFQPRDTPRQGFVLALGHLYPHKRCDRAIRAIGAIPAATRPRLVWIGRLVGDSYRAEMEALADSLGVTMEIRQDASDEALVQALNEAALLLFTPHLEPLGLAPLEANACGTPVVAIAEGGVRETMVHGENALLVDNDSPEALAAAIQSLLDNPERARELGAKGRARVEADWTIESRGPVLEDHLLAAASSERVFSTETISLYSGE